MYKRQTVFRLRDEDEIAVLEMGISDFGEMTRLAKIAKPETCFITNIGSCHLENLGDRDGVLKAKTEIFSSLKPNGNIILNGDDDKLATVEEYHGIRPVFLGLNKKYDVYEDEIESLGLKGMSCRIHMGEQSFSVLVPMPGIHMVYNCLLYTSIRTLFVWVCSVAVGSLISRAGFFFPGLIFTGPATVTEFLFIAGGTYTVSAGAAVIFRRTGKRNLCFFVILFLHKVSLSFI